jgi:hypothetical protein
VVRHDKTLADIRVIGQLLNAYFYKVLWGRNRVIDALAMALVFAPITVLFAGLRTILPRNDDLFLDNVVLAQRTPG